MKPKPEQEKKDPGYPIWANFKQTNTKYHVVVATQWLKLTLNLNAFRIQRYKKNFN